MEIYPKIVRKILLPSVDLVRGTSVSKYIDLFEQNQWKQYDELKNCQNKLLRKLIVHAYQKVPFYHKFMRGNGVSPDDVKSQEDLQRFPVVTKKDIRHKPKDFFANDFSSYKPIEFKTSGTSGTPFRYFIDKDRWDMNMGCEYRNFLVGNFSMGNKRFELLPMNLFASREKSANEKIQNVLLRKKQESCANLSDSEMKNNVEIINKFKPAMIRGYPSSLEVLADYVLKSSIQVHRPKAIFTVAEKLYEAQRKKLRTAFTPNIFEGYGGSDVGVMTLMCEKQNRHVCIDTGIMEVLDNSGLRVAAGEEGNIVTTMLNNYSQVFIRYSPGDLGVLSDETCPCGRGYPMMKDVIGRTLDILKFSNGNIIGPHSLSLILKNYNLNQFQVIQRERDKLDVKLIKNDRYKDTETIDLLKTLKLQCGEGVDIEILFVGEIPLTKAGKRKYIISNLEMQ